MAIGFLTALDTIQGEILAKRGISGKWFVKTLVDNNRVVVYPTQYGDLWDKATTVKRHESLLDLILGRTWENKVRTAQIKWQRYCDRMNEQLDRDDYLAQRYKDIER